jgi:hypothetical protein
MRARVLIGGNDDYHDLVGTGTVLRNVLANAGIAATLHVGWGERQLGGPETAALVMYTNGMRMRPEEQETVKARVTAGLGLVALHTASVTAETPEFHATWLGLIGCRFVHHPPYGRFRVAVDGEHPVTDGVGAFEIEDELYITEPVGEPVVVLASTIHEGKRHPMVTVREIGRGRVCYIALGHDGRAHHHPSFQKLVAQAARWAGRAAE